MAAKNLRSYVCTTLAYTCTVNCTFILLLLCGGFFYSVKQNVMNKKTSKQNDENGRKNSALSHNKDPFYYVLHSVLHF